MSGAAPGRAGGPAAARPRVLIVEPTASGGLAAHVRMEREVLQAGGAVPVDAAVRIPSRPSPRDLVTVRRLRTAMHRGGGPDGVEAVHAHGLRAGALAALARGGRPRRPRLVVTLHNRVDGPLPLRVIGRALLATIRRRADVVLTVSPDLDALVRGVAALEHAIIPAPSGQGSGSAAEERPPARAGAGARPPEGETAEEGSPAARTLEVLTVGRLAPQKGLDDLLDAVAHIGRVPAAPRVHVSIAGDGPLEPHLRSRITTEGLPVTLLGRREDVPALLRECQVVVSAALWEGQPVFLQEALQAGRAVVATDAGGTRWVTGDAARLVEVGDTRALAQEILAMADPGARGRAADASLARARELPGPGELARQLSDVLGIALSDPSRRERGGAV
ncbi:glycosyl transferase [Brachybacterium endophyticum]|uniref:Glycosyl transferase n=1 Tax=Brachybacterium endophyticum TaxID=2182385 RepID=A0A2U2RJ55_9MICO|nr:glycosyltransferase family 4 protein [Brachybacterium endophyticum]PWH05907.1 glycosyl transferase [Brachybacterium endophyticum]